MNTSSADVIMIGSPDKQLREDLKIIDEAKSLYSGRNNVLYRLFISYRIMTSRVINTRNTIFLGSLDGLSSLTTNPLLKALRFPIGGPSLVIRLPTVKTKRLEHVCLLRESSRTNQISPTILTVMALLEAETLSWLRHSTKTRTASSIEMSEKRHCDQLW